MGTITAVIAAVETAFDYRQTFGCDVVIDMLLA